MLIKLYTANGTDSRRLKVQAVSQMSQWIDRRAWGWGLKWGWCEDGFDLTPGFICIGSLSVAAVLFSGTCFQSTYIWIESRRSCMASQSTAKLIIVKLIWKCILSQTATRVPKLNYSMDVLDFFRLILFGSSVTFCGHLWYCNVKQDSNRVSLYSNNEGSNIFRRFKILSIELDITGLSTFSPPF